jgi:hypothetical protein
VGVLVVVLVVEPGEVAELEGVLVVASEVVLVAEKVVVQEEDLVGELEVVLVVASEEEEVSVEEVAVGINS